jgi:hypothetical protein
MMMKLLRNPGLLDSRQEIMDTRVHNAANSKFTLLPYGHTKIWNTPHSRPGVGVWIVSSLGPKGRTQRRLLSWTTSGLVKVLTVDKNNNGPNLPNASDNLDLLLISMMTLFLSDPLDSGSTRSGFH